MAFTPEDITLIRGAVKEELTPVINEVHRIGLKLNNVDLRLEGIELRLDQIERRLERIEEWVPVENSGLSPLKKQHKVAKG